MWGEVRAGTRGVAAAQAACTGGARLKRCGSQGMRGAHGEHAAHVRDAGRVPVGYVLVEIIESIEEPAHVGHVRDVPAGDGAVPLNGGRPVSVERPERRLQEGPGEDVDAIFVFFL